MRRFYKGRKRIAKKINPDLFKPEWVEMLNYLDLAVPGLTMISACTGFNVVVQEVEFQWRDISIQCKHFGSGKYRPRGILRGRPDGRAAAIIGVRVTDTDGFWHHFPDCFRMPETVKEVRSYWQDIADNADWAGPSEFMTEIRRRLTDGEPITDLRGVMVLELKAARERDLDNLEARRQEERNNEVA